MIFNTQVHGAFDPIFVVEASTLDGRKANTRDPVILAYNEVHYEGMVPNTEKDRLKIALLKEQYLSNQYFVKKQDIPVFQGLLQQIEREEKLKQKPTYADTLKSERTSPVNAKSSVIIDSEFRSNGINKKETSYLSFEDLKKIKARERTPSQKRRYNQLRQQQMRENLGEDKKEAILKQHRDAMKRSRASKTPEENDDILKKQRESMKKSRASQTPEENNDILKKQRESMKKLRESTTLEKKETLLKKQRDAMKKSREAKTQEENKSILKKKKEEAKML